jgi:lipid II isoglutaminyl synthase (glutamine-hydrolysing)
MAEGPTIVHVLPGLLGTYGDGGNVLALTHRAAARGLRCRVVEARLDAALPRSGDLYVIGGGEDSAQLLAARTLLRDDLSAAVLGGHPTLAVCAGLQLLARSFEDADGHVHRGLGLLDVECGRLDDRAVGEVVAEPCDLPMVPTLTGYENHRGTARLRGSARPLARVVAGIGNGHDGLEGVQQGNVIATYLHGPVLVRNPALADLLLTRAAGPLPAYDDAAVEQLREERLHVADPRRHRARRALLGR